MGRRVIKAHRDALAGLEVGRNSTKLSGNRENFFYSDESGCYVVGPISLLAEPQNIRIGGCYTFLPAYKSQLPSTAVNPTPTFEAHSPTEGFQSLATEVARLLGELI